MNARLVALALLCAVSSATSQTLVVRAGRLLDVRTGAVTHNAVIEIGSGRVVSIGRGPAGAAESVLDLSAYTVLPGLIDAHVHLAIGGTPRANALANLNAGFTTIVDLGARTTRLLTIKDSINAGLIPGPRVLAAGIWIGGQGGVCEFGGIGIAGGADAFRARVRENAAAGAEVMKACVSGWPAAAYANPDAYEMPDSILAAVVDESRKLGRRVVAHDISTGGVRAAVRAGVAGLAHAAYLDPALATQLAARGVFMISTLATLAPDSSPASLGLVSSVGVASRAGVRLVFGTDGGVLPHGQNALEFMALARAGVSALDAIRAATINAAGAFGIADSVGAIAPGMVADLIAVEGDPLTDLAAMQRVRAVVSRGRVVKQQQSVRDELERRYAENSAAFMRWDLAAIMALRAPDFHAIGPDGVKSDRTGMELRTQGILNGIKKWNSVTTTIDSLTVNGDTAVVIMSQYLDRMALRPDNQVHHVETWATQRETWVRIDSRWFLWRVDQVGNQRRLVDGKPG